MAFVYSHPLATAFIAALIAYGVGVAALWPRRRYVYGENAPIPTQQIGQRPAGAPDGDSESW